MTKKFCNYAPAAKPIQIRIAHNLRLLRVGRQLSQQQVANVVNMSRSCYAAMETGSRQVDVVTIVLLSDFYDITADCLLKEDLSNLYFELLKKASNRGRRY